MSRVSYDPQWRHDPVRRAAVRAQIEERQAIFRRAQDLIAQAASLMYSAGRVEDDAIFERCVSAVGSANARMSSDAQSILTPPSDTYIGNMAAAGSPIGWKPTLADFHNALADEGTSPHADDDTSTRLR